jgi:hypothetical protein
MIIATNPKFRLGTLVISANASCQLSPSDIASAVTRHARGEWGEVCDEDREENELSLRESFRLLSVYRSSGGLAFWIITEADRSTTTILMPDDY